MIRGLGIDMCKEKRFLEKLENQNFLERIFNDKELVFMAKNFTDRQGQSAYLAGVWAAKESFVKALGVGIFQFPLKDLSLIKDKNGDPFWDFNETISILLRSCNVEYTHVSLSHEDGLVIAITILEF